MAISNSVLPFSYSVVPNTLKEVSNTLREMANTLKEMASALKEMLNSFKEMIDTLKEMPNSLKEMTVSFKQRQIAVDLLVILSDWLFQAGTVNTCAVDCLILVISHSVCLLVCLPYCKQASFSLLSRKAFAACSNTIRQSFTSFAITHRSCRWRSKPKLPVRIVRIE